MKKVGIITYHHYYNHGTMLQALALQKAVEKCGCEAEIIDFKAKNHLEGKELVATRFKRICVYISKFPEYLKKFRMKMLLKKNSTKIKQREHLFEVLYKKHMRVTDKFYKSTEELCACPPQYDIYVVGSDQTWNPNVGGNPDAFFLTFAPEGKTRGSYAPSIAVTSPTPEQTERLRKLLADIEFLSCREESGSKLIERVTGRKCETVLDPTFLLTAEEWSEYCEPVETDGKYILQYFLGEVPEHRDYVKRLAKKMGLKVISMPSPRAPMDMADNACIKEWVGPGGFISLIKNAELLCTDSFHGSAFAINHEVPVYTFYKFAENNAKAENSRISNIYDTFGIKGRIITDYKHLPSDEEIAIDYTAAREKKAELLEKSYSYLKRMLEH